MQEVPTPNKNPLGYAYELFRRRREEIKNNGLNFPFFKRSESINQETLILDGKVYSNYTSYDYLGLSNHPKVAERAIAAMQQYGTSCSASRFVGGEKNLHKELESAIARLIGVGDAIVFVGGYTTNVSTITHLFSPKDLIVHDEFAHNSLLKGAVFSGARRYSFPHNHMQALEKLLEKYRDQYAKTLIIVEGVYSMDGDLPDLHQLIAIKKKYDAWLMVDEAHSMGVIGKTGRGILEHAAINPNDVDIWMGTLSKAFASCGGYIAGSSELIEYLRYTTPGFIYSVGISPPATGAALGAIEVLLKEPQRVAALQSKSASFLKMCVERGYDIGLSKDSAIIPLIIGNSHQTLYLSDLLFQRGINVQPILSPAVDEKKARLRFFLTYNHTEQQLLATMNALDQCIRL